MKNNNKIKNFATIFLECENIHLRKDVGMIPFTMYKNYNYHSTIISYKNGTYPGLITDFNGMKILFFNKKIPELLGKINNLMHVKKSILNKIFFKVLDIVDFIPWFEAIINVLANWKKICQIFPLIDVLHLFHIKEQSMVFAFVYRFLNPKGKLILKLDMNPAIIEKYYTTPKRFTYLKRWRPLMDYVKFNAILYENLSLKKFLERKFPLFLKEKNELIWFPNGIDQEFFRTHANPDISKDNIILHVGRIGNPDKRSELALKAFDQISAQYPDWTLEVIGQVEPEFKKILKEFTDKYFNKRIKYIGFIDNRLDMLKYYQHAKLVLIPSTHESFCFVAVEGGFYKVVLIGSDIPAIREITNNGEFGYLANKDNFSELVNQLKNAITNPNDVKIKAEGISKRVIENYDWVKSCAKILQYLN